MEIIYQIFPKDIANIICEYVTSMNKHEVNEYIKCPPIRRPLSLEIE